MNDIARLGFEIDTSGLKQGSQAADQLAGSLGKVADAADRQAAAEKRKAGAVQEGTKSTERATSATREHEQASSRAAGAAGQVASAFGSAGAAARGLAGNVDALAASFGGNGASIGLGGLLSNAAGGMSKLATSMAGAMTGTTALAGGVVGLAGGYATLVAVTYRQQEQFALLEARLKGVYGSTSAASEAFARITALASANGVAIDQTADAYLRLARNNEGIGLSRDQMVNLTDAVQKLGRVSGATTGELASGMMQFSQALAAGRLNGDELRSIMENMPALAKAIADGLGVSVGQLRSMGAEGQLTSDKVAGALLRQLPKVNEQIKGLPETSEQAFIRIDNAWTKLLAGMGAQLKSSEVVTTLANLGARMIDSAADAVAPETPAQRRQRIADARAKQNYASISNTLGVRGGPLGMRGGVWNGLGVSPEDYASEGPAITDQLLDAANQERTSGRASFVRSAPVAQELDSMAATAKGLREQITALEQANAAFMARPFLFDPQEVAQLEKYPGMIAALRTQLANLKSPIDAFRQEIADETSDIARFGSGGAASIGAEARALVQRNASKGVNVGDEEAVNAVYGRRALEIDKATASMTAEIEAQRRLIGVVGQGAAAEREAEVQAKAHNLQMQLAGKELTPQLSAAIDRYRDNLRQLLAVQKEVADSQKLYNSQVQIGIERQVQAAIAAGRTRGEVDALRRSLETQADLARERGGTGAPTASGGAGAGRGGDPRLYMGTNAGGGAEGLVRPGVVQAGMTAAIQEIVRAIQIEFPKAILTSGVRDGNGRSQHDHGNAADFNLRGLSMEERQALVARITSGQGVFGQLGGMGMYDPTGNLLHVDARAGDRMIWGPNRSRTSIGQTPAFFQQAAEEWQRSGASGGATGERAILASGQLRDLQALTAGQQRLQEQLREIERQRQENNAPDAVSARRTRQEADARRFSEDFAPEQKALAYETELKRLREEDRAIVAARNRDLDGESSLLREQLDAMRKSGTEQRATLRTVEEINQRRRQGLAVTDEEIAKIQQRNLEDEKARKRLAQADAESREYERIWTTTADSISGAIESAFRDAVMNGKVDAEKILKSLVADIGSQILRAFTTPMVNSLVGGLQGFSFGSSSVGLGLTPGAGGLYGAGAAFERGAVVQFAGGGVVASPRFFPMAGGGTGLAGEAGPEAIMPLKRGPDGKLGVAAGGGGGGRTQVVINDMRTAQGSQQVETQEKEGPDGERVVQIMIRDEVRRQIGSGELDGPLRANFGTSRILTKR